jgi:hypothetical protein
LLTQSEALPLHQQIVVMFAALHVLSHPSYPTNPGPVVSSPTLPAPAFYCMYGGGGGGGGDIELVSPDTN